MSILTVENFDQWRDAARRLIEQDRKPDSVNFRDRDQQALLFAPPVSDMEASRAGRFRVPRAFVELAKKVSCHRDPQRWNRLYQVLWRIVREESHLLQITTDDDVFRLRMMEKQVRRDAHKMKAFVRFRRIAGDSPAEEQFVAWHRPDHRVLRLVAPFFSRRFRGMRWGVFTPDESVVWDLEKLTYGRGAHPGSAPSEDDQDDLWRTYYRSIFNPARVKVAAMKREMPVRHWPTLPETQIIDDMLAEAPERVEQMVSRTEGYAATAGEFLIEHANEATDLPSLAALAKACQACDLHQAATTTVFGSGPATARIVLLGEQPGDQEDLTGKPFVGPAGKVLDQALNAAGIDRGDVYVTNVVKHFSHKVIETVRGKRRLHQKPKVREVKCCLPWFAAEMSMLPRVETLVCLGATAATAVIGPEFRISERRGDCVPSSYCQKTIATWHPSAILRAPNQDVREARLQQLIEDLRAAAALIT